MNAHQLHHDAKLWGDPWNFRPERFLDDQGHILSRDHVLRKRFLITQRLMSCLLLSVSCFFLQITPLSARQVALPYFIFLRSFKYYSLSSILTTVSVCVLETTIRTGKI